MALCSELFCIYEEGTRIVKAGWNSICAAIYLAAVLVQVFKELTLRFSVQVFPFFVVVFKVSIPLVGGLVEILRVERFTGVLNTFILKLPHMCHFMDEQSFAFRAKGIRIT